MIKAILAIITSVVLCTSCSPGAEEVLAPGKMKKVMFELLQADEFINGYAAKDTAVNIMLKRSIMYEQVFKINNTTRKAFYSSYKYYQQQPLLHKELLDSLQKMK